MASAVLTKFKALVQQSSDLVRVCERGPWVLPAKAAEDVVREMKGELLAVVGGDVWVNRGTTFEMTLDWFCERGVGETPSAFADRSMGLASEYLRAATGAATYVDLVVKDAMTGEALRSLGEG